MHPATDNPDTFASVWGSAGLLNGNRAGLVSVTYRHLSPPEIVKLAEEAGLKVLEWGGDVHVPVGNIEAARRVKTLTCDAGLETICYGSYYRVGHEAEGSMPAFDGVLATAIALGAPSIRVWAGTQGSDESDDGYFRRVCEDAGRIADLAGAYGVRIAFEFHGGTLNDNAEAAARLLAALPHPNIGTLWQPLVSLDEEQQFRSLVAVLPRLAHVHVFHWLPGDPIDRRPLSEGAGSWRAWLKKMHATGRSPDCLLEFVQHDRPSVLGPDAATLGGLLAEPHGD